MSGNRLPVRELTGILKAGGIFLEEPMARHTSFRIGGPAAVFAEPAGEEEAAALLAFLCGEKIPHIVVGNGSNLLVSDEGYDGVVVHFGKNMGMLAETDDGFRAGAGVMLSALSRAAQVRGLAGLAFASGIPGSFGGACIMNAGAYGGEMKDVLTCVSVIGSDGNVRKLAGEEMALSYRNSRMKKEGYTVLSGTVRLTAGDAEEIAKEMEELAEKRREKQPLSLPSAGSTFKRPEGYFAGKLISDAALKGARVGGASVSTLHAGFIVNDGEASAEDVRSLIAMVQARVFEMSGVLLEPEVEFLGNFRTPLMEIRK